MKRTLACAIALGLLGALAGAGCGDDPEPEPTGGAIALDAFAGEFSKLFCNRAFACCDAAERDQLLSILSPKPKDEQECSTAFSLVYSFLLSEQKDSVAAGRQAYDGDKAASCIAKNKDVCMGLAGNDLFETDPDCDAVFVGKVADGSACTNDEDCSAAGSICKEDVCTPLSPVGGGCTFSTDCQEGLACSFGGPNGNKCVKPVPNGEMCSGSSECESGYCDFGLFVCAEPKANGEICGGPDECESGLCEMGACAPLTADGQPCMADNYCQSGECDPATNTCAPTEPEVVCDGM
ncbi:DUF7107 domain-containing protein [Polyangium aurulentum]|uniref:DUF7107 domain-containing protein n=1 Tax=Polyangium aurulentum TaxID=2567896 RepID=UPI0010AE4DA0|nr:hypothetical protein [Polyangium aurulentum]UQA61469.1 hypothetical protein E8A73_013740 [Polyangium aurulentum]